MFFFIRKLRPEVVALIFNEIRAEISAAIGVNTGKPGNRSPDWKCHDTG